MFDKMKGMYEMARKAKAIQKKLRKSKITAETEEGAIKITMNGEMTIESIEIAPDLLTSEKKIILQNGLKKAVNQAHKKAQQIAAQESKELMGGLGI